MSFGHALDDETATGVGAADTQHGCLLEQGVDRLIRQSRLIGQDSTFLRFFIDLIETNEDALDRLQIGCLQHIASHLQRVDMVARGEGESVVAERIALVVVGNGIRKVNGISGVVLQRILQLNGDALALPLDFRLFQLWRRHDHLLRRIVELDVLVEKDGNFLPIEARCLVLWLRTEDFRRVFVIPSAVGLAHTGTGCKEKTRKEKHHTDAGKARVAAFCGSMG